MGGFFELYLWRCAQWVTWISFLVICDVAGVVPIGRLVAQGEGGDDGQRPGDGGGFGGLGGESGEEDDRCDGDADADDSCDVGLSHGGLRLRGFPGGRPRVGLLRVKGFSRG